MHSSKGKMISESQTVLFDSNIVAQNLRHAKYDLNIWIVVIKVQDASKFKC